MNAKPITAPGHVVLPLLAQYASDRRSAERERMACANRLEGRVFEQQWERLTQAMNNLAIRAIRAGYDKDLLFWLVQGTTDRQLVEIYCDAKNNDQVMAMITKMRQPVKA